ncbi:RNA polymerase sigma factor [Pedobacter sp.]|uniref:RNA polymerase sigma factor n=1 Tax=Pedobacter sp. TaxID=1411316 RepID=UPI00396CF5F8
MSNKEGIQDFELVARYRKGDDRAFDIVYNKYAKSILNTCMRILSSRAEAEDVVHDTFVDALLKLDYFTYSGSFGGWLARIAINKSLELIRKRKLKWVDIETVAEDYEDTAVQTEASQDEKFTIEHIHSTISSLPENYRIIFNLHAIDGIPQKEIAEMLNISHNNVRIIYHRAKDKIKTKLRSEHG